MHSERLINTESSLVSYFHQAIERASEENNLTLCDHTHWYLTNLLHTYSSTDRFFDHRADGGKFTPLAEYYMLAAEANCENERRLYLQRVGDIAIVVSGLFAPALRRKAVGIDYYMAMGENAYGFLADSSGGSTREKVLGEIFEDLSSRFSRFVAVLSCVGSKGNTREQLLSLIDRWQSTGEPELEKQLRARGVILSDATH